MDHLRSPVRKPRVLDRPEPVGTGYGQDEVAAGDDRVLEGDLPEISVMERRQHKSAAPPFLLERATEDTVWMRVRMAQEHVAGLGLDRAEVGPVVVDDRIRGLQTAPEFPPDCVRRGDGIAVGVD